MAINYNKKTWRYGDEFTPDVMNNIENGIKAATDEANRIDTAKVDKVNGKGLSTNDYTNAEKQKVSNAATAESVTELSATVTALSEDVDRHAFGEQSGSRNLWDEKWELGGYDWTNGSKQPYTDRIRSCSQIEVKGGATYYFTEGVGNVHVLEYDSNHSFIRTTVSGFGSVRGKAYAVSYNCRYIEICNTSTVVYNHDIAIIEGTSGTYEPYIASNAQLTVGVEESEVRDAELQALGWCVPSEMPLKNIFANGVLTQYVGRVDLGSLSWVYDSSNGFFYSSIIVDVKIERRWDGVACYNSFYPTEYGNLSSAPPHIVGIYDMRVYVIDSTYNDASTFVNHVKGKYLYYELATYKTFALADYPSIDIKSVELQALGWCVPSEMPLKNIVDSDGKLHQRVGRWDLSNRSFTLDSSRFRASGPSDIKKGVNSVASKVYVYGYVAVPKDNVGGVDKSVGIDNNGLIWMKNSSYQTSEQFSNSLIGQYIYYELSTEIIHDTYNLPSQKSMISDAWDDDPSNKVYYVGDLRIDGNRLYKCYVQTDKTSGRPSVDTAHWRETSVAEEISKKSDAKYSASYDVLELGILEGSTYRLFVRENSLQYYKGDTLIWSINGLHI